VPPEANPILGLRTSPSGAHLLLLIKGAPAELWKVGGPPQAVSSTILTCRWGVCLCRVLLTCAAD